MGLIEITPDSVLLFMAGKSEGKVFKTTPEELRELANCIEDQRPLYRCEDFSNWDSINCLLGMKSWAPMMFKITYQGKEDRWEWDEVEVNKNHKLWDYMYERYVPQKEIEYFEKGYQKYIENRDEEDLLY